MSIAVLINIHDGIVIAADSASTLTLMGPNQPAPAVLNVYNNANKIANLYKGEHIGCVAFGAGSIGSASISTLLKDFRQRLKAEEEPKFNRNNYTIKSVSDCLLEFLGKRISELQPTEAKPSLGIMIGGYSKHSSLGEAWQLNIENGELKEPVRIREEGNVGINWGGDYEAIHRLILGFSTRLLPTLSTSMQPPPTPEQLAQLNTLFVNTLQAPVAFAPMPIQDAIDLAEWLVHTAEMFARFVPGPASIGGPIEVATITKHEGFRWIQRKYYWESRLNPEVPQ